MQAHIQKWGNSLGLRIPSQLAKQLKLHSESTVFLEIEEGRLIIQPPKYNLETMLKGINKKNSHRQMLNDKKHGKEAW